jgi:hypothetical protein
MADLTLQNIGEAMFNQLYFAVNYSKDEKKDPHTFLSWCMPGLPFDPADLEFINDPKADLNAAYNFATLVDVVPTYDAPYDGAGAWEIESGSRLSTKYEQAVLRGSEVANDKLTPDQENQLSKARDILWVEKTDKKGNTYIESSTKLDRYEEWMKAYHNAVQEYNRKKLRWMTAPKGEQDYWKQDWAHNGQSYLQEVNNVYQKWQTMGCKHEIENAYGVISQIQRRSMVNWKQEISTAYDFAKKTKVNSSATYLETTLTPTGFIKKNAAWTTYKLTSKQVTENTTKKYDEWEAGVAGKWGLWNVSGGVKHDSTSYKNDYKLNEFEFEFSITQAQIVRPWFFPEFLENRGWKLGRTWRQGDVSDGKQKPQGYFPSYPLHVIFVKDVKLTSKELVEALKQEIKNTKGDASVGYGPFTVKGAYKGGRDDEKFESTFKGSTVTIPGMQIIGFRNHKFGKVPNPDPDIKNWT